MESSKIFLSPPDLGPDEEKAALDAIRSGWAAPAGPALEEFEAGIAKLSGRKHTVALSSGTAALHLALLALGVKRGDYVLCSTLTFVATANAITYVGAHPVFVDSDEESGNISLPLLARAVEEITASGRSVAAVIPVDFLGSIADYDHITKLCAHYGIPVLSDAAESVGATKSGHPAGSFGDASIFSFNGNKLLTTSGGGAFLTNDSHYAQTVRHLATQAREPVVHYEHEVLGYNYRMSNILAAVGLAQLRRLDQLVARRRYFRSRYRELFSNVLGVRILGNSDSEDNCWLTAVVIEPELAGFTASDLQNCLHQANIESRPLWKPMHLQPLYLSAESFTDGAAERLFHQGLALPSGSGMTEAGWKRICHAVATFLEDRSRV